MNIGSRLTAAFSSVLVIIGAGAVVTSYQFAGVVSDTRQIIAVDNRLSAVQEIERDIGTLSRHVSTSVAQRNEPQLLSETQSVRNVLAHHLSEARAAFAQSGLTPPHTLVASTRSVYDELDTIERLARIGDWQAIRLRVSMQLDQILRDISEVVDEVTTAAHQDRTIAMEQVDTRLTRARLILATTAALSLLASLLLGYYVTRSVTQPLFALKRAAHQLAERDFNLQIRTNTKDELAEVGRDLSVAADNLRASYTALERSNADLEHFAHVVSHDLREPLRTVTAFSQMLVRQHSASLGPAASEHLTHISDATLRMNELINGILAYSRLTHRAENGAEELDTPKVVEAALHNLQVLISESNAEIRVESLPHIRANHVQMMQVFQNLISNAIKYRRSDTKPLIHISAQRDSKCWVFRVKDNGIGIRSEYHRRIFEPFQQIEPGRATGVGLGLATAKRIVEQQGGDLWVQSDGVDGSEFFFSVPTHR